MVQKNKGNVGFQKPQRKTDKDPNSLAQSWRCNEPRAQRKRRRRWHPGALHLNQPTIGRWSVTLYLGSSKHSPNHINQRLTLGSSPAAPLYLSTELNAQAALQNTNEGKTGCESELRARLYRCRSCWHCSYLKLKKGLAKRGLQCSSLVEKITCSQVWLTLWIWSVYQPYMALNVTQNKKKENIKH